MMNFLKHLFAGPPTLSQIKAENFFSRENLGIEPYPEDPRVEAILRAIRLELVSYGFYLQHGDATIDLSQEAYDSVIRLEKERAFHMGHSINIPPAGYDFTLYGFRVRVVPDDQLDGKLARVVVNE